MYSYKRLAGELCGAAIAVVWIAWALLAPGNMVFLVVAIALTILFGVLAGGLLREDVSYKRITGELCGAAIAVVWIAWALLAAGDMVFLVVALILTILLGVLSGGLIKLSAETKEI